MEERPVQEASEEVSASQVLSAAAEQIPEEITTIERLEILQASPREYVCRVQATYDGDVEAFVVTL